MNKQAVLSKLATLRLAINYVLRNRMQKRAWWGTDSQGNFEGVPALPPANIRPIFEGDERGDKGTQDYTNAENEFNNISKTDPVDNEFDFYEWAVRNANLYSIDLHNPNYRKQYSAWKNRQRSAFNEQYYREQALRGRPWTIIPREEVDKAWNEQKDSFQSGDPPPKTIPNAETAITRRSANSVDSAYDFNSFLPRRAATIENEYLYDLGQENERRGLAAGELPDTWNKQTITVQEPVYDDESKSYIMYPKFSPVTGLPRKYTFDAVNNPYSLHYPRLQRWIPNSDPVSMYNKHLPDMQKQWDSEDAIYGLVQKFNQHLDKHPITNWKIGNLAIGKSPFVKNLENARQQMLFRFPHLRDYVGHSTQQAAPTTVPAYPKIYTDKDRVGF